MEPTADSPTPAEQPPITEAAALVAAETPAPAPAPVPADGSVVIDGVTYSPATHQFKDGAFVLGKNGLPKRRTGPQKTSSPLAQKVKTTRQKKAKPPMTETPSPATAAPTPTPSTVTASDAAPPAASDAPAQTGNMNTPSPPAVAASATQAPPQTSVRATTAVVTRSFGKIGAIEASDQKLEVRGFVTEPATVEIGYGLTLNIGNYESARVDVKVSVPCYREEINEAYDFAKKWAEERVQAEVKEIRKIASGTKGNNTPF